MRFRSCPFLQPGNGFINFQNDRTDIAQIRFRIAAAEVLFQSMFQLALMRLHRDLQLDQLIDSPVHIQGFPRMEELALCFIDFVYPFLGPFHQAFSFRSSAISFSKSS